MQQVISELERLRWRSRVMLVAQRAAVVLAWTIAALLGTIVIDFVLRLPSGVRLVMLLAGAAMLAWGVWTYFRLALLFRPTLTQLALRIEDVLPAVEGRLASSVEFAGGGVDQVNAMAARAVRETERRLQGEKLGTVMSGTRTWRDLGVFAVVAVLAGLVAGMNPASAQTGLARIFLPYGSAEWPARTGVESMMTSVLRASGVHPRGETLALRASVTRGPQDQRVIANYRLNVEGKWQPWQAIVLTHQSGPIHERLIDTHAERVELYFATDDDRTAAERVDLVPPPAVRRASLTVTPPEYAAGRVPTLQVELGQGIDDRAVTETASLIGSDVTFELELNKPLPTPAAHDGDAVGSFLRETFGWDDGNLPAFELDPSEPELWTLHWRLEGTRSLPLHLLDEHGLANTEAIQFRIDAVEDRPPAVTMLQPEADEPVLATAVVPLKAEARDDVAVNRVGLEARVQTKDAQAGGALTGGAALETIMQQEPAWRHDDTADAAEATSQAEFDLAPLHLSEGDVVLVAGVAGDGFDLNGAQHELVQSPVRRLRVTSDMDFATQLRRQLGAVRQNAIRTEAQQGELQDDVADDGIQPGMDRAQAQISERIAAQRKSVEEIERMMRQNRLDDAQLADILRQSNDLLEFAGRAANRAAQEIAQRQAGRSATGSSDQQPQQGEQPQQGQPPAGEPRPPSEAAQPAQAQPPGGQQSGQPQGQPAGEQQPQGERPQGERPQAERPPGGEQQQPAGAQQPQQGDRDAQDPDDPDAQRPDEQPEPALDDVAPEDRPVVEAQQEVRDELTDLIKLLDRDEDTWVVRKQLENILQEQARLEQQTRKLGEQTIGRNPSELSEQQRSEMERLEERQLDLTEQARKLIEDLRDRAQAMEEVDPQSAEGMRNAANTAEQQQLDRQMEQSAERIQQNQMSSAANQQQQAQQTMQRMLQDIQETKRAQAQQLLRQLASLIESIQRLITVQENEINALALGVDAQEFSGLDRAMIRLNQNTQSVSAEARAAGQDARRIARSLDRAADAQGAAVTALRAQPPDAPVAEEAEERSLTLLKEAKQLAEELQQQTQQQETQRRREELLQQYRDFLQRQVALREETLTLSGVEQLDRRQIVESRRLSTAQDDIRTGLNDLRTLTSEIMDSPIFSHVHTLIDQWATLVAESLMNGQVNVSTTDRQSMIAESIARLVEALEEALAPPEEFAQDQNGGGQQGGQGNQQQAPLIPPVAQLRLLQGLQELVYDLTKDIDGRSDLDEAATRERLRDLGQQQRELQRLGEQMLEQLQQQQQQQQQPQPVPDEGEGPPERPEGIPPDPPAGM